MDVAGKAPGHGTGLFGVSLCGLPGIQILLARTGQLAETGFNCVKIEFPMVSRCGTFLESTTARTKHPDGKLIARIQAVQTYTLGISCFRVRWWRLSLSQHPHMRFRYLVSIEVFEDIFKSTEYEADEEGKKRK